MSGKRLSPTEREAARMARLDAYVNKVVADAPPFRPEQAARLAVLLNARPTRPVGLAAG